MTDLERLWNVEAGRCGYAGSEYHNNPVRVFQRVRDTQRVQMEVIVSAHRERDLLEARCKELEDKLNRAAHANA